MNPWLTRVPLRRMVFNSAGHLPVLTEKVVELLNPGPGQIMIDMTFGTGGHTKAVLKAQPDVAVYSLDADPAAEKLSHALPVKSHWHGRFSDIFQLCKKEHIEPGSVDMILMDLGVSSPQLDEANRGFSFKKDALLDMRMEGPTSTNISAFEVVNNLDARSLSKIFKIYGEERYASRAANCIVDYRLSVGPIRTTLQLAHLVASSVGGRRHSCIIPSVIISPYPSANPPSNLSSSSTSNRHPATRVFQAIRIFVNDELNELCLALAASHNLLRPDGGRLVVLSYHSLEDRLVKWLLSTSFSPSPNSDDLAHDLAKRSLPSSTGLARYRTLMTNLSKSMEQLPPPLWKRTVGPIKPSEEEIDRNPRSRSATLRAGEKY